MAEEQQQVDMDAVNNFIKTQVEQHKDAIIEAYNNSRPQQQQYQQVDPTVQARNELQQVINPFIEPGLQEARLTAADAKDYTSFYSNQKMFEHQEAVEAMFNDLKQKGRPTTRKDIYRYIVGKEYDDNPDTFTDKQVERRKQQLERAEAATDIGIGNLTKARNDPSWANFADLSIEEMEKKLDGVTF